MKSMILVGLAASLMLAAGAEAAFAAEGCGRGFAPAPNGICRPIARERVVVVPARPVVIVPRERVVVRRPGCGLRVGPIGIATPC